MALVKCQECGNEVSQKASACPKCGAPVPRSKGIVIAAVAIVAVVVVAAGAAAGARKHSAGASSSTREPTPVSLRIMLDDYRSNEIRADGQYKGQRIETDGRLGDVKNDITGSPYVTVGRAAGLEIPMVQCFLADGQASAAAALTKGEHVTVIGVVDGLMMNVIMKDCVVHH